MTRLPLMSFNRVSFPVYPKLNKWESWSGREVYPATSNQFYTSHFFLNLSFRFVFTEVTCDHLVQVSFLVWKKRLLFSCGGPHGTPRQHEGTNCVGQNVGAGRFGELVGATLAGWCSFLDTHHSYICWMIYWFGSSRASPLQFPWRPMTVTLTHSFFFILLVAVTTFDQSCLDRI
jgi:hypothetical protein